MRGVRVSWAGAAGLVLSIMPRHCLVRFDALDPREVWIPSRELTVLR